MYLVLRMIPLISTLGQQKFCFTTTAHLMLLRFDEDEDEDEEAYGFLVTALTGLPLRPCRIGQWLRMLR